MSSNAFLIVSDGACSGNPGPGGWGLIFVTPDDEVIEYGDHDPATTNNRMELMGYYRGLQEVYKRAGAFPQVKTIRAISDSKYVLDGAQSYVYSWSKNGWKTQAKADVKNQDLWEKILKGQTLLKDLGFQIKFELVKGHSGHSANDRVDQIAVAFSKQVSETLYQGPLSKYEVSLEASAPFKLTYLSLVDGKLSRHATWDACKHQVDGKKGAKYKKVTNALQEQETLRAWGIEP